MTMNVNVFYRLIIYPAEFSGFLLANAQNGRNTLHLIRASANAEADQFCKGIKQSLH